MKKHIITILFLLMAAVSSGYASTCVQDINGDGVIEQNEMWTCLATSPPICPHGIMNCTITSITLSGAVSAAQTNIQNNMGITGISADAQGASLMINGWMCNADTCSSANIGSIAIQNATVSGSVAADMISSIVGSGSTLEIYGCDGGTSCAVQLLGTINITGSTITGSASAAAGLTTISASGQTLSLSGMTCNGTVCSQVNAGTITVTGSSAICPAGSQYQCINVSDVQQCSPLPCTDDTFGGEVTPGQQICAKDLNGDGLIEQDEISVCQQYNKQYYCPLQAQDCTKQTAQPACPAGGSLSGSQCMGNVIDNYTCPGTGTVYQNQSTCNSNCSQTESVSATQNYTCSGTGTVYQNQSTCNSNCSQQESVNATQSYTCPSTGTAYQNQNTCTASCLTVTHGTCEVLFSMFGSGTYICNLNGSRNGRYYRTASACAAGCIKTTKTTCTDTYSCPAGYTLQGTTCIKNGSGSCTGPTYSCPSGYTLQGTTCTENISEGCTGPTYSCPAGYTLGTGNTCTAAPTCAQGTLDTKTMLCVIGYTCPLGSQYGCWPNTADNNVMQCNNIPCADPSTLNPVTTSSNQTSLQNDGAKDTTGQCLGTLYIFNGKPLQCRPAGVNTNFFNCCDQSEGSFLFIKKNCGEPDTDCVAAAAAGSCHFVGSYCMTSWPLFGCVQNANVYCCFSDMLARIIQEQGRPQLNSFPDGFGSTGSPDCRGFTTDEFSHIDFSKINFSEYINANEAKMQTNVQSAVNKMQQQSTGNLQKAVQPAQ